MDVFKDVIAQEFHGIHHRDLSSGSLRVIEIPQQAGYDAYFVVGGTRDLLLGNHPKDFDTLISVLMYKH